MGIDTTCKVAIIGAGSMAREHIKAFEDIPNVKIVGVHNRTESKAQALADEFGIPYVAPTIQTLYENTQADLVVITVYETAAVDIGLAAMEYPWALMMEKPPGYTPAQTASLIKASENAGTQVIVGLNRRFLSSTRAVHKSLNEGQEPRHINVFDQQSLTLAESLGHHPEVIKHWMYANSIHLVDYIPHLCRGTIASIDIVRPWEAHVFNMTQAFICFDSGDTAMYQCAWEASGPWAVQVTTPSVRWEMRPLEQASYQIPGDRTQHLVEVCDSDKKFKPGFREQALHAVNRVRGLESHSPSLYDAYQTMTLIESIYGG